jgi:hypothetical protein
MSHLKDLDENIVKLSKMLGRMIDLQPQVFSALKSQIYNIVTGI